MSLTASGVNWIAGSPQGGTVCAQVQIRSRHAAARARVTIIDAGRVAVDFDTPQPAVTPGQAAVFYDGAEVLGGGWID
jgi:tRNA-specific 2-thiouridylase